MPSMPTPNYVLMEDYQINLDAHDIKVLPQGTFARPIEYQYVPKHVVENPLWRYYNKDRDVFVYCRAGIVLVPKKILRQV
jgi:hypothetical protein